ncbi:helix-turn-helix domain-containing protein [Pseudonocardia sp.]|uniref:helix-turn-helix domain-containing protein n=1 Tax=Pseudonocardia sp. TaxID=60912 RepID=UPI003D114208
MAVTTEQATGPLAAVLRMLADEAPASEIAAALQLLAGAGAAGARAVADATRVRELLDRTARREHEGQALYETAEDLTSLRPGDEVLAAIVDRARTLLGCDSSYIALVDPDTGDAFMRVTAGTRTEALQCVRQAPGFGVGGYVIQTGRPLATSDYLNDPRIHHDPDVASAVAADDVVSIAGVPMTAGGTVIGALFAADRHRRTFDQDEIALLASLAAHAAIVIENARLFERVQADSAGLRAAGARLRAHRESLERAGRAHEQLMPMALRQAGLDEFATTVAGLLDAHVTLVAGDGAVLADAPGTSPGGPVCEVAVQAGPETFGVLRVQRATTLDEGDARILERAAQTAALLLLTRRRTDAVAREQLAALVTDLVTGADPAVLGRRAARLGVLAADRPHCVVVATCDAVPRRTLLTAAADLAEACGGIAGEHAGLAVLVVPAADPGTAARHVAGALTAATGEPVTAGADGPRSGAGCLRDVPELHPAAARCARLLAALGRCGQGAAVDELGVLGSLLEDVAPGRVTALIDRCVGALLDYDREHATPLVATMRAYFAHDRNPPATARELGVHVNTVYQRIARIDAVLGDDGWRSAEGGLQTQVVLGFLDLLGGR